MLDMCMCEPLIVTFVFTLINIKPVNWKIQTSTCTSCPLAKLISYKRIKDLIVVVGGVDIVVGFSSVFHSRQRHSCAVVL